eukprot:scaffold20863_cov181-Amphora_coffeaeformis.AAC.3
MDSCNTTRRISNRTAPSGRSYPLSILATISGIPLVSLINATDPSHVADDPLLCRPERERFVCRDVSSCNHPGLELKHKAKRHITALTGRPFSSTAATRRKHESSSDDDKVVSILQDRDLIAKIPLEDIRNFCFIGMYPENMEWTEERVEDNR